MIAEETGCSVIQHDDNSDPGMHDLDILGPDSTAAVEVVADINEREHELWKIIDDQPWLTEPDSGSWFVTLDEQAKVKKLRSELPTVIALLRRQGKDRLDVPAWRIEDAGVLPAPDVELLQLARGLGIKRLSQYQQPAGDPGKIWLTPPPSGGVIDREGTAVSSWIVEFLSHDRRADVRGKLHRSGADQRHAFVIVPSSTTAPNDVVLYLSWQDRVPPLSSPLLPPEVTHVWIVDTFTNFEPTGIRWSPGVGWKTFAKVLDNR